MATKITREILEAYLNCKTKAHLKLAGQQGIVSDYEAMLVANRQEVRQQAIGKILAQHPEGEVARDILSDRRCPAGRAVVRAERHPGRRPAIAQLRRAEAGGRAVEAGGLPLRPDAVPRGTEGRQGAAAPAGAVRPAPISAARADAFQWDHLAWQGVQDHEGAPER